MEEHFIDTIRSGDLAEVKHLLEYEDINLKNKNKVSALYVAAQMNLKDIVEFLLTKQDLDVNMYNKTEPKGHTALMIAAELGHTDVVRVLLEHPRIDINKTSEKGWTAVMYASFYGHKEVVKLLCMRKDIDLTIKGPPDLRNMKNELLSAYDLAKRQAKFEVVEILDEKMKKQPFETEVGKLLMSFSLEKYAQTLYENGIFTMETGKDLTAEMLDSWGIVMPAIQKKILYVVAKKT